MKLNTLLIFWLVAWRLWPSQIFFPSTSLAHSLEQYIFPKKKLCAKNKCILILLYLAMAFRVSACKSATVLVVCMKSWSRILPVWTNTRQKRGSKKCNKSIFYGYPKYCHFSLFLSFFHPSPFCASYSWHSRCQILFLSVIFRTL